MNYLMEWKASCVDEELTQLNVIPMSGYCPSEYLLYSDAIPRRNDGRVSEGFIKRYAHTEEGGWWCSGIDLLTGKEDLWGCFKPAQPLCSNDRGRIIKYEHPPKVPTGVFALRVPMHLWKRIADRYQVELNEAEIDRSLPDLGFWQWFLAHPAIPLCITEGAKKAGTLLSLGYAAIALPGVNSAYRTPKDEFGKRIGKSCLIPQLEKLADPNREIYIAFDRDAKPSTLKAVNAAISKIGYLLKQRGCQVKIITWESELGKGVDDLIANRGVKSFEEAYSTALLLETWKAKSWSYLTYNPHIQVNSRYLPDISIPDTAKLIGIKSPKGTGKTKLLENIVAKALNKGQWVLVIGHRVQLVQALCHRFGLKYISEIQNYPQDIAQGYGLCIDSLHPNSAAQFNALDWSNGVVVIDEIEQVLWHGLNSNTCKDHRVAILKSLKILMENLLGGNGQVYLADADLSDIAVDYLISLAGIDLEPFIIENSWQPSDRERWQVYHYQDSTPKKLVKDLERHIQAGGKPMVCLSAQKFKSQWGTLTLEAYLQKKFPHKKILRIDSESSVDPHHPAYGCIGNLDRILSNYDLVLASPSIETGVSIELQGHFTSVWCIAQGIQGENTVRQTLGRIRENVPRYIWCATYGFNKVGNGSTSIPNLLTSGHRLTQLNIRLLQQSDFEHLDEIDTGFQAESLLCWAKMAVRFNAAMINYRESILTALRREGHQPIDALLAHKLKNLSDRNTSHTDESIEKQTKSEVKTDSKSLIEAISEVREQNYQAECVAIANSPTLSDYEYNLFNRRMMKTTEERRKLRKYELIKRYRIPVTPELVALDDDGWYRKLRLHYFLTIGRPYLAERDAIVARKTIDRGDGSIFLPDFNSSQLGATIGTMEILGIPSLLVDRTRELTNLDADLQAMAKIALNNRSEIKTTTGVGIAKNASPITIVRYFIDRIGYSLRCLRCGGDRQKRIRVYQILAAEDNRQQVFQQWLAADRNHPGSSILWHDYLLADANKSIDTKKNFSNHLQFSLNLAFE